MKTDLKQSLNRAVDQLPHPSFSDIADPPVQKMKTMDRFTAQEERISRRQFNRFYRYAVPIFICLLLVLPGFGYVRGNLLVDSTIDLDVNPSIEITINRKDRVLQVKGLNSDAREILADTDYRSWDVREAVSDLIVRLSSREYISRDKRTVLLSVDSKSQENADRIKRELSDSIEAALAGTGIQPLVVRQSRPRDRDLSQKAAGYHISSGKMRLVVEAKRKAPERDEQELAGSAVDELYRLLRSGGEAKPNWLEIDDDWDDDLDEADEPDLDEDDDDEWDSDGDDRKEGSGGAGDEAPHADGGKKDSNGGAAGQQNGRGDDDDRDRDADGDDRGKDSNDDDRDRDSDDDDGRGRDFDDDDGDRGKDSDDGDRGKDSDDDDRGKGSDDDRDKGSDDDGGNRWRDSGGDQVKDSDDDEGNRGRDSDDDDGREKDSGPGGKKEDSDGDDHGQAEDHDNGSDDDRDSDSDDDDSDDGGDSDDSDSDDD